MLEKMGWKGDGVGLGKNQQGTSTHLRAVKRAESLGIGAETDAFGDSGWQQTNAAFHGVLANLKKEHNSNNNSDNDDAADDDKEARKKRKKEEKKRKKKEEKRRAKAAAADGSASNDNGVTGIRLAQNKVQAGHARKMREAKDIKNKSAADMAAIFGVKADFYKQPKEWVAATTTTTTTTASSAEVTDASTEVKEVGKERKKAKKSSKEKKKRKHSSDDEDTKEKKKKSKK